MKKFLGLTKRDLLVFFKDRQSIIFSVLTSIIVLALYVVFLKGTFTDAIESYLKEVPFLKTLVTDSDINCFSDLIMLSGVLGSALITVPFQCVSLVVRDRETGVDYDISATPAKRYQIVLAYFVSATVSSVIMTSAILTLGLIVLKIHSGLELSTGFLLSAYGIVALGAVSATAFFMMFVLFFRTSQACGAFFGMLSAAAGFVIGAYIPVSQFSESVRSVCFLFPASHVTSLLRNVLLADHLNKIDAGIGGLDGGEFTTALKDIFTFKAFLFGNELDFKGMIVYVLAGVAVCTVVMIMLFSKTYRRK